MQRRAPDGVAGRTASDAGLEGAIEGSGSGALHTSELPIQQLGRDGADTDAPRNRGQFTRGNTKSLKHGRYSPRVARAELPEQAAVRAMLAEREAAIVADTQAESTLQRDLVRTYQTLWIIESHLTERVRDEGAITGKGKTRALVSTLLTVIDRKTRIASLLGIARKPKDVSLDDWLRGDDSDEHEPDHEPERDDSDADQRDDAAEGSTTK